MNQRHTLIAFEKALNIGPVAAAKKLGTPYATYKDWKSERHKMPGAVYPLIDLLTSKQ